MSILNGHSRKKRICTKLEGLEDLFFIFDISYLVKQNYFVGKQLINCYLLTVMSNNRVTLVWQAVKVVIAQGA